MAQFIKLPIQGTKLGNNFFKILLPSVLVPFDYNVYAFMGYNIINDLKREHGLLYEAVKVSYPSIRSQHMVGR